MNLKNQHAKKDLRLAYSQGNMAVYPPKIEGIARDLSTQYPNNKPANQCNSKEGTRIKNILKNHKTRTVTRVTL